MAAAKRYPKSVAVLEPCENCGALTPIYRLTAVIFDGHMARLCPRCVSSEKQRIEVPYAPRTDQGAIQPSTSRQTW